MMNSIDIFKLAAGDKVKYFFENAGYTPDQETAKKHLVLGNDYTVSKFEIKDFHTNVWLEGVPDVAFNSCMFAPEIDPLTTKHN